jgi:hypothetical protein
MYSYKKIIPRNKNNCVSNKRRKEKGGSGLNI